VDKDRIIAELGQIIRDILDQPTLAITQNTTAAHAPGWDSFNQINIVVAAETHFGIKLRTAEFETVANVGAFAELIQKKLRASGR
jgi:acyl carrier protein